MKKKTILLVMILSMLMTACFPAYASDAQTEEPRETEIPESFDLRSVDTDGDGVGDHCYVTPVKFQNPFAACWAFAAVSAAETSLLGSVYADDPEAWKTLDLSEKQLAYFTHTPLDDAASPQNGEGNGANDPTNMAKVYGGGSTIMAIAGFAQGIGPSDEHPATADVGELFEYHGKDYFAVKNYIDGAYRNYYYSDEDDWSIPDEFRFQQDYILTEARFLTSPARLEGAEQYAYDEAAATAIKRELLQKHGVMMSLLADTNLPQAEEDEDPEYISDSFAHYTWSFGAPNHSVAIIGWDDHYPRENFLAEHQPPADGAWLAKNSWGSAEEAFPSYGGGNWGILNEEGQHTGFFWISYYDHSVCEPVALELKAAAAPQNVDQHDYYPITELVTESYNNPVSMANVFQAKHSQTLQEISCMTASANTDVQYQIYLLQDAYQTPEDGLLAAEGVASFDDAGFHRIPVDDVLVYKGQYYSAVVTLTNAEGGYDVFTPRSGGIFGSDIQKAIVNERESYLHQDGKWQDYKQTAEAKMDETIDVSYDNFPIKVYSDRAENDVRLILRSGEGKLSLLEGLNTNKYTLRMTASRDFDIGKPAIVWKALPGSEGLVEMETKGEGTKLIVTAKAAGTALLSATVEGLGTIVFPVTVSQGRLRMAVPVALDPTYTGKEILPLVIAVSDNGSTLTEGVHYQVACENNILCGLARVEITGIGACADPEAEPIVDYFAIVPPGPNMTSLSAQSGEIRLSVEDLSETGADGYEAQYRLKGSDEAWTSAAFEAGQTDLVISGLAAGEYEVQVRAFVDNTDEEAPEMYRKIEYGAYGKVRTIAVP